MVYTFKLISEAFDAIVNKEKSVEVRFKKNRNIKKGDYIRFVELNGNRKTCVIVDSVEEFNCFDDFNNNVELDKWNFEPKGKFDDFVKKEFLCNSNEKITAIFFSLAKVSIVMPVYNSELFLEETLDSISKQIFKNFELLIIDDYSNDNSKNIIDGYIDELPILYYKNQKNIGAAETRNFGLNLVLSEYCQFLDSDDIFDSQLLEQLVSAIEKHNTDIAIAEYDSIFNDEEYTLCKSNFIFEKELLDFKDTKFLWKDIPNYLMCWNNVPWNKLFRTSFLKNNSILFQDVPSSNDVYFCNIAMMIGTMIHTQTFKPLIHYRVSNNNSISSKRNPFNEFSANNLIFSEMKRRKIKPNNRIKENCLTNLFKYIRECPSNLKESYFNMVKNELLLNNTLIDKDYIKSKHPIIKELFNYHSFEEPVFNLKLDYIEIIYSSPKSIVNFIKRYSNDLTLEFTNYSDFFHLFKNRFEDIINISVISKNASESNHSIACFSYLQRFEIEKEIEKYNIKNVTIIPFYKLNQE